MAFSSAGFQSHLGSPPRQVAAICWSEWLEGSSEKQFVAGEDIQLLTLRLVLINSTYIDSAGVVGVSATPVHESNAIRAAAQVLLDFNSLNLLMNSLSCRVCHTSLVLRTAATLEMLLI